MIEIREIEIKENPETAEIEGGIVCGAGTCSGIACGAGCPVTGGAACGWGCSK